MPRRGHDGFTLLEVLVAMAILGLAVTTMMRLSSQSLRLLHLSGEHQRAMLLADQLVRRTPADAEGVQSGEEGAYAWERRVAVVPVAKELIPPGATSAPQLRSVSVAVRWGKSRSVQLVTLRASLGESTLPRTP
jgi:type II secretion system protein I